MVKSMTGYGKAETTVSTKKITVEVRTLNSKQLDLSVKLPPVYRRLEYDLRALAARAICRGKADLYVAVEDTDPDPGAAVNKSVFKAYYRQIQAAVKETEMNIVSNDVRTSGLVAAILRMPDVLSTGDAAIDEQEQQALTDCVGAALTALDGFRLQEGRVLMDDMLARVGRIAALIAEVEPFECGRAETVRRRIAEHLARLGVETDSNRLEQEMVFYIEKFDITEEKVRLANHCDYFRQTAGEEEGAGRKLGFIAQEMGREINTLGSKANDSGIQKVVVEMKDELEKIKEQLLNIL